MSFVNEPIFPTAAVSADATSATPLDSSFLVAGTCQVVSTGPVGTAKLRASNDKLNPTNWSDIPSATISVTGSGVFLIPKVDLCFKWVQFAFTYTSGSGNVTGNFEGVKL